MLSFIKKSTNSQFSKFSNEIHNSIMSNHCNFTFETEFKLVTRHIHHLFYNFVSNLLNENKVVTISKKVKQKFVGSKTNLQLRVVFKNYHHFC